MSLCTFAFEAYRPLKRKCTNSWSRAIIYNNALYARSIILVVNYIEGYKTYRTAYVPIGII